MPLKLIHGPPNSGRAGLIRRGFEEALERDPVLVVPTRDDVFRFERELCASAAALGGTVTTFEGLFAAVARAGGFAPTFELTPAQRLRAIAVAVAERRGALGPLRNSAGRPGFPLAFARLLDELQGEGLEPAAVEAAAATLEDSAYLGALAALFDRYATVRERLGAADAHGVAREAIALLRDSGDFWRERPVFLYEVGELTGNQRELVRALATKTEVTVALPCEEGNVALEARAQSLANLREIGEAVEIETGPDPGNTPDSPLLFHLERGFGSSEPERRRPDSDLVILRSAGERGEAEAIAAEVAKLIAGGVDPAEIAIALRDPERGGAFLTEAMSACNIPVALEAEVPVAATSVGGTLLALLDAEFGPARASDLLRYLRGPSGVSPRRVDWFERAARRARVRSAAAALELWGERYEELPGDIARLRRAAEAPAADALSTELGRLAATMAARPLRGRGDGPQPEPGESLELRAAAAISTAMTDLAELAERGEPAPGAGELATAIAELRFNAWTGPIAGRVRIASPYRLRTARFDHVFVASLQDGEFPSRGGGDPLLAERQRQALGLEPHRKTDAEERYLFYACLTLPRKSLFLSYRDCDENGGAEARSPLLDAVRRLLDPPPEGNADDPVEESLTRGRDLARVVHRAAEAPSEDALARSVAVHGRGSPPAEALDAAAAPAPLRARIEARLAAAHRAEEASREPGPLTNPAVLESLRAVPAYGGTTLEGFDVCSYRWFVDHELRPRPLDPVPDPLLQGGLMHAVLDRLYRERPGGDASPRPASLATWTARGRDLVAEVATERKLGERPAERAIRRSVERLLVRFLGEEAERGGGAFEPWLLEAKFGEDEDSERPSLEIDGWRLHGAIDRADRAPDGRALVQDYKVSSRAPAARKLEEEARLQLQLYLLAVGERWGATPSGALYHPLRATKDRRPRGLVLEDAAADLAGYDLVGTDVLPREEFEQMLEEARQRASRIVARMRGGEIRRDPGPRAGLRNHDVCPTYCDFAPICRRDRAPVTEEEREPEEQ
jgi:ATP-dependent helicase/DNAse subunit B